jgi:hypothetical protein
MSILGLILALAVIGFVLWLILTFIPMPQPIKTIIVAVVCILLVIWLLSWFVPGINTPIVFHR